MEPRVFELERADVKLGDLLKIVCGMSGGQAKVWVQNGQVRVNGEVDQRRGRRLRPGDRVEIEDYPQAILVAAAASSSDSAGASEEA